MSISQEIDAKINIVELAGRYLQMKKAGANYKALCPFHNEKTASFMISPTKNIAYCFSCHKGGGPVKFFSEIEKLDYREAMQIMAKEAGVELKTDYYKERGENRTDIYELYKIVANWYQEDLYKAENADKLAYIKRRGLSQETLTKFGIGYSGDSRGLFYRLKDKGFTEKDIIDSGVFVSSSRDKFFGRIVFPIANYTGNIVAFTGRIIDQGEPKYLNSPASRIFNKSEILYGLNHAKSDIGKKGFVIIVEGQMDTIALHQAGYTNAVGISGTALTKEHVSFLKRLTKHIYLCLDSDNAGVNATFSSLENLLNEEVEIRIIRIESGKDPDEFVKSGGDFQACIDHAITPVQFFIELGWRKFDISTAIGKTEILREVLKYVRRMTSRIEVDMSMKALSRFLDLGEDVIYHEYKNIKLPRVIEEAPQTDAGFDFWETLAGYMEAYDLFDLFLERVDYTGAHFDAIPSASFLRSRIDIHLGKSSDNEPDRIKALTFFIEEDNVDTQRESILIKFQELVKRAQKLIFEDEKKSLERDYDQNSNEYLVAYSSLLAKGKRLGII